MNTSGVQRAWIRVREDIALPASPVSASHTSGHTPAFPGSYLRVTQALHSSEQRYRCVVNFRNTSSSHEYVSGYKHKNGGCRKRYNQVVKMPVFKTNKQWIGIGSVFSIICIITQSGKTHYKFQIYCLFACFERSLLDLCPLSHGCRDLIAVTRLHLNDFVV